MNRKRVILGLSGGVDSSVAAYLLQKQEYEVIGIFMRNWDPITNNDILGNNKKNDMICSEEQDWQDAQAVAKKLKFKVYREDFVEEYWKNVFEKIIDEYKKGYTPNPDSLCNRYIKFDLFLKVAFKKYKADYVATGHYAIIDRQILKRAIDKSKDQSYFLAQVKKKNFTKIIFPLGNIKKTKVREIAHELNLVTAQKKDSTGICFIGERYFTKFLQNYIPLSPGNIIDIETKEIVGKHIGAMYYTIGQRKGLKLGGMKEPYYVVGHNMKKKIIYVAKQSNQEWIISTKCSLKNVNIIYDKQNFPAKLTAKFRYRQSNKDVSIEIINNTYYVNYPQGVKAVTPGQQCVFYNNEICIGSGVIKKIYRNGKHLDYL